MKLFCVNVERDGATIKKPGETSTEVLQFSYYYAAETINQVWDAIDWLRSDPEITVKSLAEVVGGFTVLSAPQEKTP